MNYQNVMPLVLCMLFCFFALFKILRAIRAERQMFIESSMRRDFWQHVNKIMACNTYVDLGDCQKESELFIEKYKARGVDVELFKAVNHFDTLINNKLKTL